MQAQRGGGVIAPTHLQHGTRVISSMLLPLYPWGRPVTHCTGSWVVLRAGLDGTKSCPHWGFIPGPSRL